MVLNICLILNTKFESLLTSCMSLKIFKYRSITIKVISNCITNEDNWWTFIED
jgi:hypothetical protein